MSSSGSSDEGEIRDSVGEKANPSPSQHDGSFVDRPDRARSTSPEPRHQAREIKSDIDNRSLFLDRAARGIKRHHPESYDDRSRYDPRRFKVHYETINSHHRRRSRHYDDVDQFKPSQDALSYDEREPVEKRRGTRRPSTYRGREDSIENIYSPNEAYRQSSNRDTPIYGLGIVDQGSRHQSVSNRGQGPLPADEAIHEAKITKGHISYHSDDIDEHRQRRSSNVTREEASNTPDSEPINEATLIEERRKRREAIKAKYKSSATPLLVQVLQLGDKTELSTAQGDDGIRSDRSISPMPTPPTPLEHQYPASPAIFAITNDQDLVNPNGDAAMAEEDGPSAADYDPTIDMREDKQRDYQRHHEEIRSEACDVTGLSIGEDSLQPAGTAYVKSKKSKDDFDMFAEDDDMFADDVEPQTENQPQLGDDMAKSVPVPEAKELDVGMLDNWDDGEGYYKVILGELLNGRYHVQANLGKGMFSGVVRAMDNTTNNLVAIKLIRNNETMRKAGNREIEILQRINQADPEDKKHMIRLERFFEHKGHLCMVFENLSINLREVLKKFGRDVGINLRAVRAYAQQMFLGLSLLRKCNVLHADLKPDNILVNETRNMLKVCDLGSASDASENEITPYLVSRFYRAPEIILGMPYDFAIDVWSVGCTLYELYTGKILFTGRTNNQMLRSIMDCRGKFTTKILKKAQFAHVHFDELANFRSVEQDKLTGKDTVKTLNFQKPLRDLRTRLMSASRGLTDMEAKDLALFADLLDRCLALNPEKRCTPVEALKHPFISRVRR